jgi:hypothetical protein
MDLTGTATITGTGGDATYTGFFTTAALDIAADQIVESMQLTDNADVQETFNSDGEAVGFRTKNKTKSLTINFFPTSTDSTAAKAKLAMELPKIPSKVALSNFFTSGTTQDALINGDWIYKGGGTISTSEDVVKMTLPLIRYLTSPKTAAQLTTATT